MAHTVLQLGQKAQVDQSFAGWLPCTIERVVRERDFGQDRYKVRVEVRVTLTKPRRGYKPGEILTVDPDVVLPRAGWRTGSNPNRTYHPGGFCYGWSGCEDCGRDCSQVPEVRRDAH